MRTRTHQFLTRRLLPVVAATGLLLTMSPAADAESLGPDIADHVTTAGRWLIDQSGRVLVIHGENVVDKTAPYTPQHYGFDADHARFLRDHQFNGVRLGLIWEAVEPAPGVFDDHYLDSIADTITLLADHGIHTLVEFHQDRWGSALGGEGAPAWATLTEGRPDFTGSIYTAQFSPAVYQAFSNFFANSAAADGRGLLDHFTDSWTHTVRHLRDTPGIIGYGILNEPSRGFFQELCAPGTPDCPPPSPQQRLRDFDDRIETAIRTLDARTPILESGYVTDAVGAVDHALTAPDPATVYSYNSYALPCSLGVPVPIQACGSFYDDTARAAREIMDTQHRPAILTEFGATANPEILRYQTNLADTDMTSWFHWNYGGNDPSTTAASPEIEGIITDARKPPVPGNINQANLDALVRPYPQRVSGTPTSWHYDLDTGRFTFTYTVHRADGTGDFGPGAITTIALPSSVYPDGAQIQVSGGRVVRTDNGRVGISADANAQTISVEVVRRGRL